MNLDPKTTAIVLIEYQNEFTSKGGVLHDAVATVMNDNHMLENTVKLVTEARKKGASIMHAPITFAEGYGELTLHSPRRCASTWLTDVIGRSGQRR